MRVLLEMIARNLLFTGFCLIFICSLSVHASLPEKWFFDCKDGQRIPLHLKCNAHKDCADGSDETFVECRKVSCPELSCSYGGCYEERQHCDGKEHCWDHTDEHPEFCSPNTTNTPAIDNLSWPQCGMNQFKCVNSSECLAIELVCDGIKNCQDGSDEKHQNCLISKCPNETFRCAYGGCLPQAKVCDHVLHCWDKSDELPEICSENGNSTWIIYDDSRKRRVRATQEKEARPLKSCKVPRNLHNVQLRTLFGVLPYQNKVPIVSSTVVRLSCLNNTELYGSDLNHCLDGVWQDNWPKCKETCRRKFIRDTSIQAVCQYGNQPKTNCNQKDAKLFTGTNAYIYCTPSYRPEGDVKEPMNLRCTKGRDAEKRPYWSLAAKKKPLHCVPDCGRTHSAGNKHPWIVSLFTSDIHHRKFTFTNFGYILSPWSVLVSLKSISTDDNLRYAIAEGLHKVEYTEYDEQAYKLHSVNNIFKSRIHAILDLVNPFILSPSVRPICLPPIPQNVSYTASKYDVTITENGQNISYVKTIAKDIISHTNLIIQQEKSNKIKTDE